MSETTSFFGDEHFGSDADAPCTVFEKTPLMDPQGNPVDGLYVATVRLNNPKQYNSYTTEMVKGVIAGFNKASRGPQCGGGDLYRHR